MADIGVKSVKTVGFDRTPIEVELRVDRPTFGLHITKRAGRKPEIQIDGDSKAAEQFLTDLAQELAFANTRIEPKNH